MGPRTKDRFHARPLLPSWPGQRARVRRRDLRAPLRFQALNLNESPLGVSGSFDLVFCRNVLIYFDRSLQGKVHRLFYDSLVNFGILGLGGKESLKFSQYEDCYEQITSEKIYRKIR